MGQIYSTPKEIGDVPELGLDVCDKKSIDAYFKKEEEYLKKVQEWCKKHGSGKYAGEVITFPVGDGKAVYVVWKLKPVSLIHVPLGDAWQFQYAHRLTAADVKKEIEGARALAALFTKNRK